MHRVVGLLVAIACTSVGCVDGPVTPLTEDQLVKRLRSIPGVEVEAGEFPATAADLALEFQYYVLTFTQLVDHDDPKQGTFKQQVRLLHRNELAPNPMIVQTAGYADIWGYKPVEITQLFAANQITIEHRYNGSSRPTVVDWSKLTIAQTAADEHEIISALRSIYHGAFITTGGSKGGMTAIYHRRFYPDDVDGTVAYVAPLSRGPSDASYQQTLDEMSTTECRRAVRSAAVEMLARHRDELVKMARAQPDHTYERVLLEPAVEAAVASLEWSFWQYEGIESCNTVPPAGATAEHLFAFLDEVSPVAAYDDENVAFYEAYVYQARAELGYPSEEPSYLEAMGLLRYSDEDYVGELPSDDDREHRDDPGPAEEPDDNEGRPGDDSGRRVRDLFAHGEPWTPVPVTFDPSAMAAVRDFVAQRGDRLLFIYGGGDPWSARPFELGNATRSALFVQANGTHRTQIGLLAADDRSAALDMLADWTGVAPVQPRGWASGIAAPDEWSRPRLPASGK